LLLLSLANKVKMLSSNKLVINNYCNKTLEIKEVDIPSIEDKLKSKNWNIEIRLGLDYLICPMCQRQNRYLQ